MPYVFVTANTNELEYQNYEPPKPRARTDYKRLLIKALGGIAWFMTTFDLPLLIWGT